MVTFYKEIYFSFERYFYNFIYNLEKILKLIMTVVIIFLYQIKKILNHLKTRVER